MKKILCLDFDGVIHSYKSEWRGARNIFDLPVTGAIQFIEDFIEECCNIPDSMCAMAPSGEWELNIYSSRSKYFGGKRAMKKWLVKHGLDYRYLEVIKFPSKKPPATLIIDDRVFCFKGIFPSNKQIKSFKSWYEKE